MKKILIGILIVLSTNITNANNDPFLDYPISYEDLGELLQTFASNDIFQITNEGKSSSNKDIYLVKISHKDELIKWRILLFGQQHGNEPAGKDALITLIHQINSDSSILPKNVELWIVPMLNPDGAINNSRRNGNNIDLNRDHQLLTQSETIYIHDIVRAFKPHITVDCHEFTRDSKDYTDKGWIEWPQIMMDCSNNPILGKEIYNLGMNWVENAKPVLESYQINYTRYIVGSAPPEGEIRFSTTHFDDARNSLGLYGGLSFIIESGLFRNTNDVNSDLEARINAYLVLLEYLIENTIDNDNALSIIEKSMNINIPDFIPINYFWGGNGLVVKEMPVIDTLTNDTIYISIANHMGDLIVKKSVIKPKGYIIDFNASYEFIKLLDRHNIEYTAIQNDTLIVVEPVKLLKVEDEWDNLYSRYDGRNITEIAGIQKVNFKNGSIIVQLNDSNAIRAAMILEPTMLYGLYQYPKFYNLIDEKRIIPVYRIVK